MNLLILSAANDLCACLRVSPLRLQSKLATTTLSGESAATGNSY